MMHLSFRKNIRTYDSEVTGIVIQLLLILITQFKITLVTILHVTVRYFVSVFKYFCLSTSPEMWRYDSSLIQSTTQQEILDAVNLLERSPWYGYR